MALFSSGKELEKEMIREAGMMTEWRVFGALAVNYLEMPHEAMLLLDENEKFKKKVEKVLKRVMKNGNFGHNNDLSYRSKYIGMRIRSWQCGGGLRTLLRWYRYSH